jgi:L-rhamnose mutarotase
MFDRKEPNMKSYGRTLNLKDDPALIRRYIENHANPWEPVERQLELSGVVKIRIFLHGRRLFMYMETRDDFDSNAFLEAWMKEPRCIEWENLMQQFQEQLPGSAEGEWWIEMDQIYGFDGVREIYANASIH